MLQSTLLAGVPHGFTGVAEGDLTREAVGGPARHELAARLGGRGDLVTAIQVHGARVVDEHAGDVEADAIVSTSPDRVVAVRVADCVPILYTAPGGVAAVHAGWRGTAAGITLQALRALCERVGVEPAQVRAAIGPCICGSCYEVGPEVLAGVGAVAVGDRWRVGVRNVDLAEANASVLRAAGVQVDVLGACTRCGTGFWSHRRDGAAAGRQVGAIRCS